MATIIDALIVTLGLDTAKFAQGSSQARSEVKRTKDDANRAASDIDASGKKAAMFFSRMKSEALALAAIFLGGKSISAFAAETVNSLAALNRSAHNLSMPIDELAAFEHMIQRSGGSAQSAETALRNLGDGLQRLNTLGDKAILPGLAQIGGSANDSPMELIRKFSKFAEDNAAHPLRVLQVGQMLNIPEDVINRVNRGVAALDAAMRKSKDLDKLVGGQTDRAIDLQEAWGSFREAADSVGAHLLDALAPALTDILKYLTELLKSLNEFVLWLGRIAREYPRATTAIVALASAVLGLSTALRALSLLRMVFGGAGMITALFGGGVGAIGTIATGIGTLTTALASLLVPVLALVASGFIGWWATHISAGAGAEELEKERLHTEQQAREHPELVVPRDPKADPAKDWYKRTFPQWMRHRDGGGVAGGRSRQTAALPSDIEAEIRRQSLAMGLDPDHMVMLARAEGGGYDKISGAGAIGPMQLMPGTARELGVDPHNWRQNVEGGLRYYRRNLDRLGGNYAAADAGYNAGPNARSVRNFAMTGDASGLPQETKDYVATINYATRPGGRAGQMVSNNDHSSETHIAQITIQTQATDARGIAASIDPAIRRRQAMVAQSTSGLS